MTALKEHDGAAQSERRRRFLCQVSQASALDPAGAGSEPRQTHHADEQGREADGDARQPD
jgi:hypothetical protein